MASSSSKIVCLLLILSLALPGTLATKYEVCDNEGWTVGVNIAAWLLPKIIHVGDSFRNFKSPHTVAVVDEIGYLTCDASKAEVNDVSGSFSFTFTKTGIYSFISAGAGDCLVAGLKMQVIVL
ncbi:hypothetical protein BUALT_Bualt08G0024800 [Buddleja alternifolia]|uniref:Phytocyanin domain-containing protein n=1 Tax=Buddleja alternifolia TaxID=168488 RepID=A0AAV6X4C3_9LAMI|nr:hypothetical protein BUALT_Bualt08G0024800 [Buddleja alternifolia]